MKFDVITPYGSLYQDEIEYAVIYNDDGQTGILENHMPIVIHINLGYIKLVKKNRNVFIYVEHAIVEYKMQKLSILAIEAQMGKTLEKARETFLDEKAKRKQLTKKENIDYSRQERELRENISKSKAGSV